MLSKFLVSQTKKQEIHFRTGIRDKSLIEFGFPVAVLGVGEELVEGGAIEIFPAEPDGLDLRSVVNIGQGVGR